MDPLELPRWMNTRRPRSLMVGLLMLVALFLSVSDRARFWQDGCLGECVDGACAVECAEHPLAPPGAVRVDRPSIAVDLAPVPPQVSAPAAAIFATREVARPPRPVIIASRRPARAPPTA